VIRRYFEVLHNFRDRFVRARSQLTDRTSDIESQRFEGGFCDKLFRTARKLLILNGEMLERSIRHAWKAIRATLTEQQQDTPSRITFNELPPQAVPRWDTVNVGVRRRF
jgi:hypothetical protein